MEQNNKYNLFKGQINLQKRGRKFSKAKDSQNPSFASRRYLKLQSHYVGPYSWPKSASGRQPQRLNENIATAASDCDQRPFVYISL